MTAVISKLDGVRDMIDGLDSRHDDLSDAVAKIITALEVLKDRGAR